MLQDRFGRVHDYLRISITNNCNLRCFYCMPDEDFEAPPSASLMQAGEIEAIAAIFVRLGVSKIRLTGGEPLVRKDAATIIEKLSRFPVELTLTTNGIRLPHFLEVLQSSGIRSVNVSLDTLQKDKFTLMTRRNHFEKVKENIGLLVRKGLHVKLNMVVMKGVNDSEINDFIAWTKYTPVHVRFIEFMPFEGNHWQPEKVFGWKDILGIIESNYEVEKLEDARHDTAKKYRVPGYAGTFAVISTITAPFCGDCNRMRLTADGKMKNCLFSQTETDLLSAFRRGEDIEPLIRSCILGKEAERGGQFTESGEVNSSMKNRSMIAIGG